MAFRSGSRMMPVQGRGVDEADGIPVGLLLGQFGPSQLSSGPSLVDDHERLAQVFFGNGGHDPGPDIGLSAGGIGDDNGNGLSGIPLRVRRRDKKNRQKQRDHR